MPNTELLTQLWQVAIDSVNGESSVIRFAQQNKAFQPDYVIAIGKAASSMCLGALKAYPTISKALVVSKYGHIDAAQYPRDIDIELIEAGHPIPDQNSLLAGNKILSMVSSIPADHQLLLLVSGGASALAEKLVDRYSLRQWQQLNSELIASGVNIATINQQRQLYSQIKGGKLLSNFTGQAVQVYAISDVEGDAIETIGAGIGDCRLAPGRASSHIIASNAIARMALEQYAISNELTIRHNAETLYMDLFDAAKQIANKLIDAPAGLYIWGGETTIQLPENPGCGGRNQSLALAIALLITQQPKVQLLVAGTDGSDGATNAAGAIVDGYTVGDDIINATQQLDAADAGSFLQSKAALLITNPTDTNVMDLVIALVTR